MKESKISEFKESSNWILTLTVAAVCRLFLNTARRIAYPFAPEFSRELNVPLTSITSIIAVNQATGFIGLFFGPVADRVGYEVMMLAGLFFLSAGMLAAGIMPTYAVVFAGLALAGVGKNIFDPSLQAFVGRKAPFARRGFVIGLLELSWAGSTLLGIPLAGIMMERWGWRSPFFFISISGFLGMVILGALLNRHEQDRLPVVSGKGFRPLLVSLFRQKSSIGLLGYSFFISAANDNLFVVYGAWFEKNFQLSLSGLGFGAAVIGAAELGGEFLTALLSDKIGLNRAVIAGIAASSCCYLLLPFCGGSLSFSFFCLFFIFLFFEFTIVSSLSLCTELLPNSRATMMSGFLAAAGLGRVAGALAGGPVWVAYGISGVAAVSFISSAASLVFFFWGMRGWESSRKGS